MPELPEVEVIARGLRSRLCGSTISSFRVLYPSLLKGTGIIGLGKILGCKVIDVRRRGKYILMDTAGDALLLFHLRMTGQFVFRFPHQPWDKHTHFGLSFVEDPQELRFRDVRKFGSLSCLKIPSPEFSNTMDGLGPEPLEIAEADFLRLFRGRSGRLKSLLLDQRFLAGIGNIYADEILFRALLNPLVRASSLSRRDRQRLWDSMRQVLEEAVAHRGSSVRDFVDTEEREGNFQRHHRVYGREGLPCVMCGQIIKRIRLAGRSSHYCPICQRPPDSL